MRPSHSAERAFDVSVLVLGGSTRGRAKLNKLWIALELLVVAGCLAIIALVGVVNVPGPVTFAVDTTTEQPMLVADKIQGSFQGKLSFGGDPNPYGSACLVFQEVENRRPCASGCATRIDGVSVYPYCDPSKDAQGISTCWYTPVPDIRHCKRGVNFRRQVHTLGPVDAYPLGANRPIIWRVLACQSIENGKCSKGKGISTWGASNRFPP